MSTVTIVHHRVRDFDTFKKAYDSFAPAQKSGGVLRHYVLRPQQDPNNVVVVHTFDNARRAKEFFENKELADAMAKAGVDQSTFQLEMLDEVESGSF